MRVTKETINRAGNRVVTVELSEGETLLSVKPGDYYKLGYPVETVIGGYILQDMVRAYWCSLEQKWLV